MVTAQAALSQQIEEVDPGNTSDQISQLNTSVGQLRIDLDNRHHFHYGDTAPATSKNGDAWFNSSDLHLYIKHINAWVRPDRVEDPALDAAVTELKAEVESLKQSNTNEVSAIESSLSSLQTQVNAASRNRLLLTAFTTVRTLLLMQQMETSGSTPMLLFCMYGTAISGSALIAMRPQLWSN